MKIIFSETIEVLGFVGVLYQLLMMEYVFALPPVLWAVLKWEQPYSNSDESHETVLGKRKVNPTLNLTEWNTVMNDRLIVQESIWKKNCFSRSTSLIVFLSNYVSNLSWSARIKFYSFNSYYSRKAFGFADLIPVHCPRQGYRVC